MKTIPATKRHKKIVVIGGGTGTFTVLSGLRKYPFDLTAVVAMSDEGGSSGVLREEFGVLPPGDVRQALIALSHTDNKILSALFSYRFEEGKGLSHHSFGNLMLTALERLTGSFEKAVKAAEKILSVQGSVIPVTLAPTRLFAKLENGRIVKGETNIDIPKHDGALKIERVWLKPRVSINPRARKAILEADLVVIGPGDLYSSLIPNMLVRGMPEALAKTRAKVAYIVNLMTKFGETNGFRASDFLRTFEEYAGKGVVDVVVANGSAVATSRLRSYARERAFPVEVDRAYFVGRPKLIVKDLIRARGFFRHDPQKLARLIAKLLD